MSGLVQHQILIPHIVVKQNILLHLVYMLLKILKCCGVYVDCMRRSEGVSIKISLASIIAYVLGKFSLKA